MRWRIVNLGQRQWHQFAVMGKNRVSTRHLHQADSNAMAVGHGRLLDGTPVLPRPQTAIHLAGEAQVGRLTKTEALKQLPHFLRRETQRTLGSPNVRGLLDD